MNVISLSSSSSQKGYMNLTCLGIMKKQVGCHARKAIKIQVGKINIKSKSDIYNMEKTDREGNKMLLSIEQQSQVFLTLSQFHEFPKISENPG